MELIIAKSAGFCYGVKRAIDITENTLLQYNKVYIKGNIVNNTIVVKKFEEKGLKKFESITELNKGDNILIRAHGCTPLEVKEYELCGCNIIDATCPNVKNIHNIVQKHANTEYKIIIIGDKNHPEVLGIAGNSGTNFEIINDIDEIKTYDKVCIVEQTTFSKQYAQEIIDKIMLASKEQLIYNTICKATETRQNEVKQLAKECEAVIIIGDSQSANSKRLYEISKEINANSIFIEKELDLDVGQIKKYSKIGITAGASTPNEIIEEIVDKIKEGSK